VNSNDTEKHSSNELTDIKEWPKNLHPQNKIKLSTIDRNN